MTRHVDVPQRLRAWLEAPLLLVTVGEESLEDYRSSGFRYMKVKGSRGLIFVALMKMLNFNIDSPWDERGINHQFSHSTSHPFLKPFPLASGNLFVSLHWLPMSWPFLFFVLFGSVSHDGKQFLRVKGDTPKHWLLRSLCNVTSFPWGPPQSLRDWNTRHIVWCMKRLWLSAGRI